MRDVKNLQKNVTRDGSISKPANLKREINKRRSGLRENSRFQKRSSLSNALTKRTDPKAVARNTNLKKQLRDAKRLLTKDSLSSVLRAEVERRIEALEKQLEEKPQLPKSSAMSHKYKKIKMYEHRKALKAIQKIKRRLESASKEEVFKLELELMEANVDSNYILHFPSHEKYISLYAGKDQKISEQAALKQQEIRNNIKDLMLQGKLSDNDKYSSFGKHSEKTNPPKADFGTTEGAIKSAPKLVDDFFASEDSDESTTGSDSTLAP